MTTDLEQWERLQALFHMAEGTAEGGLDAFLLDACPEEELRVRARTLILAARHDARQDGAGDDLPQKAASVGKIGPYTVVRQLGSGGIGAVYLVERLVGGAVQRMAVKVLSPHAAGPLFTERFSREQHILASLDHPHITRMLDAGVDEGGRPFLVMEFVDGVHLDAYCDAHAFGIPQRLEVFLKICEAVAYAHRNLVVHLDLKPSNILVTEPEGVVKLLDFGTSKLIQPDSLLTTTVMATPAYASPEQLRDEGVTTASDIYSLGAVLFELLAGRRPNQDSSVAIMIERSIKELPPEPLTEAVTVGAAERRGVTESRLRGLLMGDLSTIVAKCLQSRPVDRYGSVDALIGDVRRFLEGRPVLARPQTTTYRIAKFVRRNRKSVVAGTVAVAALAGSLGYAAWRQQQAVREGRRALQMQTFMYQLFKLANTNYTGKPTATVAEFLQLGVTLVPEFIKDSSDQRAAKLSLAESMVDNEDYADAQTALAEVIASAQAAHDLGSEAEAEGFAGLVASNLGKTEQGEQLATHALALAHDNGVTPSARVRIEIFYVAERQTNGYRSEEYTALMRAAVQESREKHLPERERAFALISFAEYLGLNGHIAEGEPLLKEAAEIYGREPYAACDRAEVDLDSGYVSASKGDLPASLAFFERAYEGFKACRGPANRQTLTAQGYVAGALLKLGRAREVVSMLESSLPQWRQTVGPSHELYFCLIYLDRAYLALGQYAQAEETSRNLVAVQNGKVNPTGTRMASSHLLWALALQGEGRYAEALRHAVIAEEDYAAIPVATSAEKAYLSQARTLESDLRTKLLANPADGATRSVARSAAGQAKKSFPR